MRDRFNAMRTAMRWSWKDIDTITGRKNASTNIAKRVPAWSHLAIEVHEGYQALLQLHLVEIIRLRLGREWKFNRLSGGAIMFISDVRMQNEEFPWIELSFGPGDFQMTGNTSRLIELVEQLKQLHPRIEKISDVSEEYAFRGAVVFDPDPEGSLERMGKRSRENSIITV
jgi:hypothetical protein